MEMNKPTSLSSSSSSDHQHPDPDDHVSKSAAEFSFGFEHLQINANGDSHSQQLILESAEIDDEDQEEEDDDEEEEEEEEEEDEEGDFTFTCIGGDNDSPITEDVEGGQIRPVFPLFDQSLLLGSEYDEGKRRFPISVQVDKVFVESPRLSPSGDEEADGVATGTFHSLSKESDTGTPEMNIKSNSTGFSKLWRFRDKMNRSNSDGRDAFVFLESPDRTTTSSLKPDAVDQSVAKVNAAGKGKVVKKVSKAKKATASAHELYLKQKGGQTEEERRRSYLPYRPGVMGFFTNVNGGLSKNVHPF